MLTDHLKQFQRDTQVDGGMKNPCPEEPLESICGLTLTPLS